MRGTRAARRRDGKKAAEVDEHTQKRVLFEILLYAALTLDALSVAFQDRGTPNVDIVTTAIFLEGALILLQFYFVWLAAQRRAAWPRWALTAVLLLCDFAYSDNWRRGNGLCERDRNRVMRAYRGRALFVFHRQCPRLVPWVKNPSTR